MAEIKEKQSHVAIEVKTVGEPVTFGNNGKKVLFTSAVGVNYATFNAALFGKVVVGAKLDADVEVQVNGTYTNNIVTQLYEQGNPVFVKQQGGGWKGGGGGNGHNPETNASIESQVAFKGFVDLRVQDKIKDDDVHYQAALAWGLKVLTTALKTTANLMPNPQGTVVPPPAPKSTEPVKTSQSALAAAAKALAKANEAEVIQAADGVVDTSQALVPPAPIAEITITDLVNAAREAGYDPQVITATIVKQFHKPKAAELTLDQRKWLLEQIKAKKLVAPERK